MPWTGPARATSLRRPRQGRTGRLVTIAVLAAACGGGGDAGVEGPTTPGPTPPGPTPPAGRPVLPAAYRASGHAAAGHAFVHLFEWPWNDIAAECEEVLGPAGWHAVQVSPPQEHIVLASAPWWERYQPVSHAVTRSRSGTAAEFAGMVARCRAVGVDIYVDAVLNHMTAGDGTGTAGTTYTKYEYPGLFTRADFHPACGVSNYQNAANVQDCELLGLADLRTADTSVQRKLAEYLASLARLGVAGFRLDAAKHMQPVELDAILARTHAMLAAEGRPMPYWFAEVIDYGGEAVTARDYFGLAYAAGGATDITEFRFRAASDHWLSRNGRRPSGLADVSPAAWQLMPSEKAVVFLENHDTQRDGGLWFRDAALHRLANVWLLAQPYGYPKVLSGFAFERGFQAGRDAGPPTTPPRAPDGCAPVAAAARLGEWTCDHRDPWVAAMVAFRRAVAGRPLEAPWSDGADGLAFSRGDVGVVVINAGSTTLDATIPVRVAPGTYCDLLSGGRGPSGCAGRTVVVSADRSVTLSLDARSAIAVRAGIVP